MAERYPNQSLFTITTIIINTTANIHNDNNTTDTVAINITSHHINTHITTVDNHYNDNHDIYIIDDIHNNENNIITNDSNDDNINDDNINIIKDNDNNKNHDNENNTDNRYDNIRYSNVMERDNRDIYQENI